MAAVEDQDNHLLARSLVASYKGCVADFVASGETLPEPSGYQRHGRDGVSATVEGRLVGVGNAAFLRATLGGSAGDGEEAEDDPDMPPRMRAALERRKKAAAAEAAAKTRDPKDPKDCAPKDPAAAAAADAALRRADAIMGEGGERLGALRDRRRHRGGRIAPRRQPEARGGRHRRRA